MNNQNQKMLIGAVVAAGLAIAVYYGLISQQTATNIQTQTNQTLGTGPAGQQSPEQTPTPQTPTPQTPTSAPGRADTSQTPTTSQAGAPQTAAPTGTPLPAPTQTPR